MLLIQLLHHQVRAEAVADDADKPVFALQADGFFFTGKHTEHFAGIGGNIEPVTEQLLPLPCLCCQ